MKKIVRILLYIILPLIVALIIAVVVSFPYVIKKYINEHGQEYSGRKTSVQEIKINYFNTSFSVIGFKLMEADGQSTFVAFDTMLVNIKPLPLLSAKLVVQQFRLVKPEISVVRKDSSFNFSDILTFINSKPKTTDAGNPSKPFVYFLNNISMEKGKLVFFDKTVNDTTTLNDLGFTIPSLSFNQDEIKDAGVKFHFENGGFFQAKTDFKQKSGTYHADFTVDKLDIAPFLPYAKGYFKLTKMNGLVGGNFHLTGNTGKLDSILLKGEGNVADFAAYDLTKHKVLAARSGSVILNDTYPMKFDFKFGLIKLVEPFMYVEMKDSTVNLLNLMVESPKDTVPFTYAYQISKFRIEGGKLDLRDNTYEAPFDYHLSEIAMKVDSISSSAKWLNAFATMRLNKRGKLVAQLGVNPSDPYELKLNYVITNFQLSDLNIFSQHYTGYPFLLGNMYYKGNTVIANKQLTSENKLIIRNVQLGKRSGGLMDLPLKLALYLLKDIHGDIILDLPVTGDLNDPKTKIGKLVWQVVKNVIVKVVASPFLAIGKLMGVDPTEVKGLEFDYADTTLTARHLRRIKLYTEIEQKKPDMKVELNYFNDVTLEKKEIAKQEAAKMFQVATGSDLKKDDAKFKLFLAEKLHSDTISEERGVVQLVGEHKLDSIQHSFSQKRITKIEAALKNFSDSTKIKIILPNKLAPENVGSRPSFGLKYAVEE